MSNDLSLCDRARNGDLFAASELVTRHYQSVFAYLRRLSGSDDDASDLTQKTFARAWQSLGSYAGRSTFASWLHGIAHHVFVDWLRRQRPTEVQSDEWWESCASPAPGPLEQTEERDLARQLYRWVDELDEEKRQTVHLHYYQHLTLDETAEALGVATSTVKYRLREALDRLRAKAAEPKSFQQRRVL